MVVFGFLDFFCTIILNNVHPHPIPFHPLYIPPIPHPIPAHRPLPMLPRGTLGARVVFWGIKCLLLCAFSYSHSSLTHVFLLLSRATFVCIVSLCFLLLFCALSLYCSFHVGCCCSALSFALAIIFFPIVVLFL